MKGSPGSADPGDSARSTGTQGAPPRGALSPAEEELLESLAPAIRGTIFLFRLGADGKFTVPYASADVADITGIDPRGLEFDFESALTVVPPADAALFRESIVASARDLSPWRAEFRVRHPRKGEIWIEGRSVPRREADGATLWHGYLHDVTEKKRASQAIRESEERFRALVETTADWVWEVDAEGRYTYASGRLREVLGYDPREVMGRTPFDLMPPDQTRRAEAQFAGFVAARRPFRGLVNVCLHKDGHEVVLETSGAPIFGADRSFLGYRGVDRDVSDRIRADREIARERTQLRTLIDTIPDLVWLKDDQGVYLVANPVFERLMGAPPGGMLGRTDFDLFPHEVAEAFRAEDRRVIDTDAPRVYEEWVTFPRSVHRSFFQKIKTPMRDSDGKLVGVLGIARDITDGRAAAEEIRRLNSSLERRVQERTAELEAANREMESFSYAVSHDLRSPLRALNGFSQMLIRDLAGSLPESSRGNLERIRAASSRMSALIDGLLVLSRTTRGELRHDSVDLSALAEAALGELAGQEPGRPVGWSVEPGLAASGDAPMLDAVMRNLLGNAWKYTARTAAPRIRVYRERDGGRDLFCVSDNGAGFDMAHAGRLFQPFQRLHREDEFPGLGIGLATVQRIVQRHGGSISAEASPGKGATFRFTLGAMGPGAPAAG